MDLYQAILSRHSVRRYRNEPLDKETLAMIDDIAAHVRPLVPENRFRFMRRDVVSGEDLIAAMGGYGRVLTPPHYLVAYTVGDRAPLVDLGYRMEQICVQMVQLGVSVCFIGSLGREDNVRVRFRLTRGGRTGAFLIFGRAAETVTGRTINAVIRRTSGGATRLDPEDIFYDGAFDSPAVPPKHLAKLVDAGRRAPSANNAQPWRFLWRDGDLWLLLEKHHIRYGSSSVLQEYRYFDGGICMANLMMAMEALDMPGRLHLLGPADPSPEGLPDRLEPLARIILN
ncbi:MAG: nitroreductase family protein [Anaerolineae bacterium]|jgi:hypothetical protein|nr:nitroreductase family protein [Anaerolineae bacterium]